MTVSINPYHHMTLTEVAAEMGITRQKVREIELVALEKLRNNPKMRGLYEGITEGQGRCNTGGRDFISVYAGDGRAQ